MKAFDIALKDLSSSFRSAFAIVFMFVIPLLITGMFYLMFGGMDSGAGIEVPVTKVVVANLDTGSASFSATAQQMDEGAQLDSLGEYVVDTLQNPDLAHLLEVLPAADAEAARSAVDRGQAGVAVIIPPDFSTRFTESGEPALLEFYADPTLTIGPGIVRSVLSQFMDGMSSSRIAIHVAVHTNGSEDQAIVNRVMQQYLSADAQNGSVESLIALRSPSTDAQPKSLMMGILGPIMGGMLIFYAFFTGASTAQTILREEERRTLQRLFTTPTPQRTILTGKFLSVFLTVLVQVSVLLVAARLIFGIHWGAFDRVALVAAATVLAAATFGIFVNSMLKSTKQSGVIFGGVLTITGMTGMISIFTQGSGASSGWAETIALVVPQGWAVRGLTQAMNAASLTDVLMTVLVLLVWSAAFFWLGIGRFQKRYA